MDGNASSGRATADLHELLDGLGGDGTEAPRVAVERVYPDPGYLRIFLVGPDGPDQLLQRVRELYGPGVYRFRPYGRRPNGRTGYLQGQVQIELAPVQHDEPAQVAGAAPVVAPVVVREGGGLPVDLLVRLLDKGAGKMDLEGLAALLKVFASLQQPAAPASSAAADLETIFKLQERLERRQGGKAARVAPEINEGSLERMMLMSIVQKILEPAQARPPAAPPAGTPAAPAAAPAKVRAQPVAAARPTRAPNPRPQAPRPPPPAPPEDVADDDDDDDDDNDVTMSLEDDLSAHLDEMSQDPDVAAAWLVQNVFAKIPRSVLARLQALQNQFMADAGDAGDAGDEDDDDRARVLKLRGYGGGG